jgi:hypothetical protein
MNEPGQYALVYNQTGDFSVTGAGTLVGDWLIGLDGMQSMLAEVSLSYDTGGTSIRAYLQTSVDGGASAVDIACKAFATVGATVAWNFSAMTPHLTQLVPTDGALADDTAIDGILGDRVRLKLVVVGTYANTVVSGRIVAR